VGLGVSATLGVEGSTPAANVGVGGGVPAPYMGSVGSRNAVLTKMRAPMTTNTKTMAQDWMTRDVAVSRSSVNMARFRSRWAASARRR
jgi:hypothetical protein